MTKKLTADEIVKEASEHEALRFLERWDAVKESCESPIEELLLAGLYSEAPIVETRIEFMNGVPPEAPYYDEAAFIYSQVPVGQYRVDFLVQDASLPFDHTPWRWMVIECDGHDYHERTKEQARRDKQRDRFFQSKGWKVLRFTGSEIYADPVKCAEEIINELACNDAWRNRT